ncbi:MAG: tetratricopeptide repeat protein [Kofleriaceae bacterium]
MRAGRLALTASDFAAAASCFSKTIELDRALGDAPPTSTSRARRREALAGREEAHRQLGDLASDPQDLDELQRLCDGEPARLADCAIRRAQRMLRLGDYQHASIATVVAEDHAVAAHDDRLRGEALRVRGEILERLGRFDEALAAVGAARELFHRQRAVTDEMAAMIGRGRIHLLRAHYELARDAYRPVLALIENTGDPWLERIVTNHVAVIDMCLGNYQQAMLSVQRSLELCRRYGDRAREGDGLSVAGIILLEVGLYDGAASMFAEALEILSRTASRWSRADCLIYAGLCDLRRGHASGLGLLDEAVAESRRLGARYLEANALVARAGAKLRLGDLDGALQDAADGTEVASAATSSATRSSASRVTRSRCPVAVIIRVSRSRSSSAPSGCSKTSATSRAPKRRCCWPRPRCSPPPARMTARPGSASAVAPRRSASSTGSPSRAGRRPMPRSPSSPACCADRQCASQPPASTRSPS